MTAGLKSYPEVVWGNDLDPNARETESDYDSLVQDVMHIIVESLGSNMADPNRGIGAIDFLNGDAAKLALLPSVIDAQLTEDPRITTSASTLTADGDGTYTIAIQATVAGFVVALQYSLSPNGVALVAA